MAKDTKVQDWNTDKVVLPKIGSQVEALEMWGITKILQKYIGLSPRFKQGENVRMKSHGRNTEDKWDLATKKTVREFSILVIP